MKKSPILSHLPLHYIPYGVNTRVFNVRDKQAARSALGVPPDAHVISFRSPPPGRNFKGAEYVEAALQKYRPGRETWLLIFEGMGGLQSLRTKYKVIEMGWLDDQVTIAQALQAVDLFLMPSTAEAFGLMAIEAMACGVPAIVFEGTALPETINAPECGIAVPYEDSEALAHAIDQVLADEHLRLRLRENGLRYVAANHTFDAYAAGYLELYSRLAAQPRLARA